MRIRCRFLLGDCCCCPVSLKTFSFLRSQTFQGPPEPRAHSMGKKADTLQVWSPAHWALLVIRQLQRKEDEYRAVTHG